ncbi:MAG: hemerythrin domain-containing protein [Proteobacteria bacterium]|nr:hemerythrin domain-containing protein [Pseudomonadota bacterium]MBS0572074.1 hemerythrin domain-containing protein [Pseudomonadota bacterium]
MTVPDDSADLTAHIENRYHARHREQLPSLIALADRVESVHAGSPDLPAGLALLLRGLADEMEAHMQKEERILFPAIRSGATGLGQPIAVMRADHAGHEADMARIRALTAGLAAPEGACGTWQRLYDGLGEFLSDLQEHMRLENDVLFPRFEAAAPSLHKGCACHG